MSAQTLQGAVQVLSSLAMGRLFGPGFVEVSPTSNPRGCHYGHVQQRLFRFLSLPLDVSCLRSGDGISLHEFLFSKYGSSPVNIACKYLSLHDFCYQEIKSITHDILSSSVILLDLSLQVSFSDF